MQCPNPGNEQDFRRIATLHEILDCVGHSSLMEICEDRGLELGEKNILIDCNDNDCTGSVSAYSRLLIIDSIMGDIFGEGWFETFMRGCETYKPTPGKDTYGF